jgi:hypothetical protein
MSCHKIIFDADQMQRGLLIKFGNESAAIHLQSTNEPDFDDFAIFVGDKIENDELLTIVYLTPAASRCCAQLIAQYSGTPCDKPNNSEQLRLTLGRGDAERLLN